MLAIFWNCHGLGHVATIRALRELCTFHRPSLIFISETKISNTQTVQRIADSFKFEHAYTVPAQGTSSGLALLWKDEMDVQVVTASANYISAMILNDPEQNPWFLTGVYRPTNPLLKLALWTDLQQIGDLFDGPWCVIGDFNAILAQNEKIGGKPFASGSNCSFRKLVNDSGLVDMGFIGYPFT